uniref:Uncharacterized protein n=1 Tax=Romanomermis culicivorax TaxID=13658 RepID=A0A915IWZ4_ROMCU
MESKKIQSDENFEIHMDLAGEVSNEATKKCVSSMQYSDKRVDKRDYNSIILIKNSNDDLHRIVYLEVQKVKLVFQDEDEKYI